MEQKEPQMACSVLRRASAVLLAGLVWLIVGPGNGATAIGGAHVEDAPRPPASRQADQATRPSIMIHVQGGLLSVKIHQASWEEVLPEITRQTGILLQVQGTLTGTVNQEFEGLPLAQGLRRLWR